MRTSSNMILATTIAAISTPPGKGGVAIIRISGPSALEIGRKIFRPMSGKDISEMGVRRQIYGRIFKSGSVIDDGMLTYFKAPNSYTGEDTVEISCHGGMLISASVLESAFIEGAVPAERGEFTKRAFINGRLSLSETEGISMLLEASTEAQLRLSRPDSRSRLAEVIDSIRASLVALLSSVYARIDYPEEDLGELTDDELMKGMNNIRVNIDRLLSTYSTGKAVAEGISTVICGKPNVGKSTLYNLLVGENAAIVTDIPGTTRDLLEKSISLGDVMLRLFDTAGIRENGSDAVENIGIMRSRERLAEAELVFALFDSSRPLDTDDLDILNYIGAQKGRRIAVITKCDPDTEDTDSVSGRAEKIKAELAGYGFDKYIVISAEKAGDEALEMLRTAVGEMFLSGDISIGDDAIISTARQHAALVRAENLMDTAVSALACGLPQDAVCSDLELALGAVGELDGRAVSEEVVSGIFANFCVGK